MKKFIKYLIFFNKKYSMNYNQCNEYAYKLANEIIDNQTNINFKNTENYERNLDKIVWYKIFHYGFFLEIISIFIITFLNFFLSSKQNILGFVLHILLGFLNLIISLIKIGFKCNFLSIFKIIILIYNLFLGIFSLFGEILNQETLGGLTGSNNITNLGLILSILDITISIIGFLMMTTYYYANNQNYL